MKRACSLTFVSVAVGLVIGLSAWGIDAGDIALPSGTQLVVKLTNTLSTKGSEEGDPWRKSGGTYLCRGTEVIPANSTVRGRVTFLQPAGRATGRGEMRLVAETISTTEQGTFTIVAQLKEAQDNKGSTVKDAEGTVEGPGKSVKNTARRLVSVPPSAAAGPDGRRRKGSPLRYGHWRRRRYRP